MIWSSTNLKKKMQKPQNCIKNSYIEEKLACRVQQKNQSAITFFKNSGMKLTRDPAKTIQQFPNTDDTGQLRGLYHKEKE